jgi:hypothetical protein
MKTGVGLPRPVLLHHLPLGLRAVRTRRGRWLVLYRQRYDIQSWLASLPPAWRFLLALCDEPRPAAGGVVFVRAVLRGVSVSA